MYAAVYWQVLIRNDHAINESQQQWGRGRGVVENPFVPGMTGGIICNRKGVHLLCEYVCTVQKEGESRDGVGKHNLGHLAVLDNFIPSE